MAQKADVQNGKTPVKLVIYDFDQTITEIHLYHELDGGQVDSLDAMNDAKLLEVFGGEDRKKRLDIHFERVTSSAEIAIISFGWVAVIKKALKRIGLGGYFENVIIIGADSEELKNAGSKAHLIFKMKSKRKLKFEQVMFIDDDGKNVQKATSYCETMHINPRTGMSTEHMERIEEMVGVFENAQKMDNADPDNAQKNMKNDDQKKQHENHHSKNESLKKYKVQAPKWFDELTKKDDNEMPVIPVDIEGAQTPDMDDPIVLNVPLGDVLHGKLKEHLADIGDEEDSNNKQ